MARAIEIAEKPRPGASTDMLSAGRRRARNELVRILQRWPPLPRQIRQAQRRPFQSQIGAICSIPTQPNFCFFSFTSQLNS